MNRTIYVKILLLLFLIMVFSAHVFSKEDLINSHKLLSPLNIDGSPQDWAEVELYFDKKVKTECAFRNDGETLFILFVLKDRKYLSSIQSSGLTVWFNPEGNKKKNYGINFLQKMVPAADYVAYLEKQQGLLSEADKNKILANPSYIFYQADIQNKQKKNATQPAAEGEVKEAIFRTKSQGKGLAYEFAIPLQRMSEFAFGVGAEPGDVIKVGFEWGGMTEEYRTRKLQRTANSESRFEQSAGVSARSVRNPPKYTRWVDVQLAENK